MDEVTNRVNRIIEDDDAKLLAAVAYALGLGLRDITVTTTVKGKQGILPIGATFHLSAKELTEGSRALRSTRTA